MVELTLTKCTNAIRLAQEIVSQRWFHHSKNKGHLKVPFIYCCRKAIFYKNPFIQRGKQFFTLI